MVFSNRLKLCVKAIIPPLLPLFINNPLKIIPFAGECAAAFDRGQDSLSSVLKTSADLLEIEVHPVRNSSRYDSKPSGALPAQALAPRVKPGGILLKPTP